MIRLLSSVHLRVRAVIDYGTVHRQNIQWILNIIWLLAPALLSYCMSVAANTEKAKTSKCRECVSWLCMRHGTAWIYALRSSRTYSAIVRWLWFNQRFFFLLERDHARRSHTRTQLIGPIFVMFESNTFYWCGMCVCTVIVECSLWALGHRISMNTIKKYETARIPIDNPPHTHSHTSNINSKQFSLRTWWTSQCKRSINKSSI